MSYWQSLLSRKTANRVREFRSRSGIVARAKPSSMVVVLDLDECLVHSRVAIPGKGVGVSEDSFVFGTSELHPQLVHVTLRPYLKEFLKQITSRYETYIFTAGQEVYASPLLDILDPTGTMFSGRFFSNDLTFHDGLKHHVKDLRAAFSRKGIMYDPRRVVLVDNSRCNFALNPCNGFPIADFVGDRNDSELKLLINHLRELERFRDVRPALHKAFGLKANFMPYDVLHEEEEEEDDQDQDDGDSTIYDSDGDVMMEEDVMDEDAVVEVDDGEDAVVEEVEEDLSLDQDSESVDVEEDVEDVKEVQEVQEVQEVEQVEQVLRRSPRLRNVPKVDYRKYL